MDWQTYGWAVWLGAALVLAVGEMLSLDLVLLMLAGGSLAGMVTALLTGSVVAQVLVAVVVAIGLLGVLRPNLLKKLQQGPTLVHGHRKLLGRQGTVTEPITLQHPGRIKVDGESWQAVPYDETLTIEAGETVDVLEIKGATAYVHPVPRLEA